MQLFALLNNQLYFYLLVKERNISPHINKEYRMNFLNNIYRLAAVMLVLLAFSSCTKPSSGGIYRKELKKNWQLQNSSAVTESGEKVSSESYQPHNWYAATVPTTVLNTLVKDGVYKNIFVDDNLEKIPSKQFNNAWWYRTEFDIENIPQNLLLHFEGINYKANIWLNGKLIADTSLVKNTFLQYKFDITSVVREGKNTLAVEVFPPVAGDFSIGFVDWNPAPPDHNMGIFRGVYLEANEGVEVFNPYVVTKLNPSLNNAKLTASVELKNSTKQDQFGEAVLLFNGEKLIKPVEILSGQTKKVLFTADEFEALNIDNPQLWWPHTLGEPHLYHATFEYHDSGRPLDSKTIRFGIRTVSDYFTEEGHRSFKVNGKKVLIRGGGWVDRLLLDDTYESVKNQLEYVKDMNLNTVRLEGFWGNNQHIYSISDSLGLLIMVGWSCHWEWENYLGVPCDETYGGIQSGSDITMMSRAWQDQIVWLRNHPSIFAWFGGSDCKAKPQLEKNYFDIFAEYDSTRVYLASAKEWSSLAGPTGVKMRGPYDYEPPVYWFADTLYGGAFGFNTETGPGAQVPPLESMQKMLSVQHLWPMDSMWNFHCGRNEFNTMDRYTKAMEKRYGKATSVEDYTKKAQLLNYELMRPMFEAFSAYRYQSTGVIQWMLNSAWPETYWQLYDYYLMPNGAYYGAKKASQPYHVIYDPAKHALYVVNDKLKDLKGCKVKVRAYDKNSILKFKKELNTDLMANSGKLLFKLPEFNWNKDVCFLDLRLIDNKGNELDNNFYWLSAKKDILDYNAKLPSWYYHTPSKQYADFTALNHLPKAKVSVLVKQDKKERKVRFTVTLTNESNKIAFFINSKIIDKKTGNTILPVLWSDNYVSLLPREKRVLTAFINEKDLKNITTKLIVKGYSE